MTPTNRTLIGDNLATVAAGSTHRSDAAAYWTYQLIVTVTSGSGTAAGTFEGTNDPAGQAGWTTICTLSATDTTPDSAAGVVTTWLLQRARCTSITGTGAVAKFIGAGV